MTIVNMVGRKGSDISGVEFFSFSDGFGTIGRETLNSYDGGSSAILRCYTAKVWNAEEYLIPTNSGTSILDKNGNITPLATTNIRVNAAWKTGTGEYRVTCDDSFGNLTSAGYTSLADVDTINSYPIGNTMTDENTVYYVGNRQTIYKGVYNGSTFDSTSLGSTSTKGNTESGTIKGDYIYYISEGYLGYIDENDERHSISISSSDQPRTLALSNGTAYTYIAGGSNQGWASLINGEITEVDGVPFQNMVMDEDTLYIENNTYQLTNGLLSQIYNINYVDERFVVGKYNVKGFNITKADTGYAYSIGKQGYVFYN